MQHHDPIQYLAITIVNRFGGGSGCTCSPHHRMVKKTDPFCPWCNLGQSMFQELTEILSDYELEIWEKCAKLAQIWANQGQPPEKIYKNFELRAIRRSSMKIA